MRKSVSCAKIFRAVSAELPRTMRRAKMPKLTSTTVTNEIRYATAAYFAALRCESSGALTAIPLLLGGRLHGERHSLCKQVREASLASPLSLLPLAGPTEAHGPRHRKISKVRNESARNPLK